MATDLLPPNASPLERALAGALARISDVPVPLGPLWSPADCPLPLLPWLAWGLSVDSWDADWTEAAKRNAVARSIAEHRVKGTRASVEAVLARFDALLRLVEWHEVTPRGAPHTFEVLLPMVAAPGLAPGGPRSTAAFAEAIAREVDRAKPLREHFVLIQQVVARGAIGLLGVARLAVFARTPVTLTPDLSPGWETLLQTEDGEPLEGEDGQYLDTAP